MSGSRLPSAESRRSPAEGEGVESQPRLRPAVHSACGAAPSGILRTGLRSGCAVRPLASSGCLPRAGLTREPLPHALTPVTSPGAESCDGQRACPEVRGLCWPGLCFRTKLGTTPGSRHCPHGTCGMRSGPMDGHCGRAAFSVESWGSALHPQCPGAEPCIPGVRGPCCPTVSEVAPASGEQGRVAVQAVAPAAAASAASALCRPARPAPSPP